MVPPGQAAVKYLSIATIVLAGTAAAFAQLPYGWAHVTALAVSSGIAGLHMPQAFPGSNPKGDTTS